MTQAASARQRRGQSIDRSPRSGRYSDQQTAGLQALTELGGQETAGVRQLYVTVVIPCYNEDQRILDRTIVSLLRQLAS